MKKLNLLLKYIICMSLVSSCTYKKVDKAVNEVANTNSTVPSQPPSDSKDAGLTQKAPAETVAKVNSLDLDKIREKSKAIKTSADALAVIKEIEATTINHQVWSDFTLRLTDKVISSLTIYNFATIRLLEIDGNSDAAKAQIKKYQEMALASCNQDMDDCKNVEWLRRDPRSSLVIAKLVGQIDTRLPDKCETKECEADYYLYYDLLAVGFSIANGTEQSDLKILYLKRAISFSSLKKQLNDASFARHGRVFQLLLSQHPIDQRDERIDAIVKQYKPWTYSRLKPKLFPFGAEKIFSYASKHLMYDSNGQLNEELKAVIKESQSAEETLSNASFRKKYNVLKSSENSKYIFSGLRYDASLLDDEMFYDEYFYMVDRFFRDHINLEEVTSIWNGSKKSSKRLLDVTINYIKIELIGLIVETNMYFTRIVGLKDLPNDRMFKKTIDESLPLTQVWERLFTRVEKMSLLIKQQVVTTSVDDTSNLEAQVNDIYKGIKRNVKFLSVYPNMLMVGFFMINLNAGLTIETWWGAKIAIDPKTIVTWMLNGEFDQPWYLFAGDSSPLNKTEIIYAYYYALNAGAFETFSVILNEKNEPVLDRLSFFKNAFKKTIEADIAAVDKSITDLIDYEASSDAKTLFTECSKLTEKTDRDFKVNMNKKDLMYYSIYGGAGKGIVKLANGIYDKLSNYYSVSGDENVKDSRGTLRSRLQDRLTQMKGMKITLLENVGRMTFSLDKDKNDKIKKKLNSDIEIEMSEIEVKLKKYLQMSMKVHKKISDCVDEMQTIERERQSLLFKLEIENLAQIFEALKNIHEAKEQDRAEVLKSEAKKLNLGKYEEINGGVYKYSVFDLITRFGEYSKNLKPGLITDAISEDSEKELSVEIRKVLFLNPATGMPVSKSEFISSAMSHLSGHGSGLIQWLRETHSIRLYWSQINALIAMYRMGIDLNLSNDPNQSIKASEIIQKALKMSKYSSIQEHEMGWMNMMGQPEIVPRSEFQGFLFDQSEINFRGVLDGVYIMATRADIDLDEAARYSIESQKRGSLIFPIPLDITKSIDGQYQDLVSRAQKVVCDLNHAVLEAEKNIDPQTIKIIYRLQAGQPVIYTPNMVSDPNTKLLNPDRKYQANATMTDFYTRRSFSFYKEEMCK